MIAVVDSILVRRRPVVELVTYVMAKQRSSGSRFSFTITGRSDEYVAHRVAAPQRDRDGTERSVPHVAAVHHKPRGILLSEGTSVYCILQHGEEFRGLSMCKRENTVHSKHIL